MRATIERSTDPTGDRAAMPLTPGGARRLPEFRFAHLIGCGAAALGRLVMTCLAGWRWRRQRAAAASALRAWDDRMLKDIGLTRGEIVAAVDGQLDRHGPARGTATDPAARRSAP